MNRFIPKLLFVGFMLALPLLSSAQNNIKLTYQGELRQAGTPPSGVYDFEFRLYDAANGGTEMAPHNTVHDLSVDEGLFSTELDFGVFPFEHDSLWLEIAVKEDAQSNYTVLLPRQALTSAPYAMHARIVGANGVVSGSIEDNTITAADLAPNSVGSSEIIENQVQRRISNGCPAGEAMVSVQPDGSVNCDSVGGPALWNRDNTSGIVWTPSNVTIGGEGLVGAASFVVRSPNTSGYGGMYVNTDSPVDGRPFYGYSVNGEPQAWTEYQQDEDSWKLTVNNLARLVVTGDDRVGMGVNTPTESLDVGQNLRVRGLGNSSGAALSPVYVNDSGVLSNGPTLHHYTLTGVDFTANTDITDFRRQSNGYAYFISGNGTMAAPVHLPEGAVITAIVASFVDNTTENLRFRLTRSGITSNTATVMSEFFSSGQSSSLRTVSPSTINFANVSNDDFGYFVYISSDAWDAFSSRVRALKISYLL